LVGGTTEAIGLMVDSWRKVGVRRRDPNLLGYSTVVVPPSSQFNVATYPRTKQSLLLIAEALECIAQGRQLGIGQLDALLYTAASEHVQCHIRSIDLVNENVGTLQGSDYSLCVSVVSQACGVYLERQT
jgi:hypothetical protein